MLIIACVETPFRIAFFDKNTEGDLWNLFSIVVDTLFLFDVIFIFNTAFYDEDFKIIEDRKAIANQYLKSWFLVDILGIFPLELLVGGSDINGVVRIARIGRLYKLIKLTKLLRILKIIKGGNKLFKYF